MARLAVILMVSLAGTAGFVVSHAAVYAQQQPTAGTNDVRDSKLIEAVCGSCHAMGSVLRTHRTKQAWEEIIEWMMDEGAVLTDDEFDRVLRYLSVRSGRVDVNTATSEDLRAVLELTDDQVGRVMAARTAGRRILNLEQLAAVTSLPPAFLEARKARIAFEGE